jgi:hypothetical protein
METLTGMIVRPSLFFLPGGSNVAVSAIICIKRLLFHPIIKNPRKVFQKPLNILHRFYVYVNGYRKLCQSVPVDKKKSLD